MAKHNKKRNTAFIYETLLREVVKQTVSKDKTRRDITISILKECFAKGTALRQELDLYKMLTQTTNLNEKLAEKLLEETVKQHSRIDQKRLFDEQSKIIAQMNKDIAKSAFSNFVPNYKDLATIAQVFASNLNPKSKVLLEAKVVQNLSCATKKNLNKAPKANGLVVNSFVSRFNGEYKGLFEEQKTVLNQYINSFQDNGTEFRFHLNEEVGRLKDEVQEAHELNEIKSDNDLKEKLNKVSGLLEDFNKAPVNENKILLVLKVQGLIREFKSA